ncbi:hypothetical protein [Pontibacter litorisediminis]|uniref:hypothetical protein n=1 Tax=Pontibacter litorisediminis TaxID=1846260 RepID=UPI0023ED558C|nr:hypothetical protein [Pontibacter litorisediminis]
MTPTYKSVKLYDRTAYTLSYIQNSVFIAHGVRLSKVQALDLAVTRLGIMLEKMKNRDEDGCE